ncbi:MAG TPA: hypothetical protein VI818_00965 [Candidatus Thermoplasmatota archaeon]|nr:hypothetical protein [Candidatus Thermoplasmatota archaeon]
MQPSAHPRRFLGVAGPTPTEQEKAGIQQAVFLLRYRLRILDAVGSPASME